MLFDPSCSHIKKGWIRYDKLGKFHLSIKAGNYYKRYKIQIKGLNKNI